MPYMITVQDDSQLFEEEEDAVQLIDWLRAEGESFSVYKQRQDEKWELVEEPDFS